MRETGTDGTRLISICSHVLFVIQVVATDDFVRVTHSLEHSFEHIRQTRTMTLCSDYILI